MANNNFVYYKDLNGDENILNLQIDCAKKYYEKIDNGCKDIESKAQKILTASLTMLGIIFAFITFILKEKNHFGNIEIFLVCLFVVLIATAIIFACFFALSTFRMKTYHIIGKNDILSFSIDIKKQLIAKYINYGIINTKAKRNKRDLLNKTFNCFYIVLGLMFIYLIMIFVFLNSTLSIHFISLIIPKIILSSGIIFFILFLGYKKITANKELKEKLKLYEQKEKVQQQAYYNHINYPENSEFENWLLANEQILFEKDREGK